MAKTQTPSEYDRAQKRKAERQVRDALPDVRVVRVDGRTVRALIDLATPAMFSGDAHPVDVVSVADDIRQEQDGDPSADPTPRRIFAPPNADDPAIAAIDRYWNVQTKRGPLAAWQELNAPNAYNPYVVHRVLDSTHALVVHTRQPAVVIYVAEMIPADVRAVALDACLQGDPRSFDHANWLCETHATTERLAQLSIQTILIEADSLRVREQAAPREEAAETPSEETSQP